MYIPKILTFGILILCCCLASCINSQDSTLTISKEDLLLTIANDQDFKDYRKGVLQSARLVALKEVDFEEIDQVLDEQPTLETVDLCDEKLKEALATVRGGDAYWKTHCYIAKQYQKLEDKFKISSLTDKEIKKIFKLAEATDGLADELSNDILNQKKH